MSDVDEWVAARKVFRLNDDTEYRYPVFQVGDGEPVPAVADVLGVLTPKLSDRQVAVWFELPNAWLGGWRKPADVIRSEPDRVLEAARHEFAEGEY